MEIGNGIQMEGEIVGALLSVQCVISNFEEEVVDVIVPVVVQRWRYDY